MLRIVDPVVRAEADPAARLAAGVRLMLGVARAHPQVAAFVVRGGPPALSGPGPVTDIVMRDLAAGLADGSFCPIDPRVGFDLVVGAVLAGFHTVATTPDARGFAEDMARAILLALGVPEAKARRLASRPLAPPVVGDDSLLARASIRGQGLGRLIPS